MKNQFNLFVAPFRAGENNKETLKGENQFRKFNYSLLLPLGLGKQQRDPTEWIIKLIFSTPALKGENQFRKFNDFLLLPLGQGETAKSIH